MMDSGVSMYMILLCCVVDIFCFKQKTVDEVRISDWSSDVCSSDLRPARMARTGHQGSVDRGQGRRPVIERESPFPAILSAFGDAARRAPQRHHRLSRTRGLLRGRRDRNWQRGDRKSVVEGKSVSVRGDLGGRRIIKKKKNKEEG